MQATGGGRKFRRRKRRSDGTGRSMKGNIHVDFVWYRQLRWAENGVTSLRFLDCLSARFSELCKDRRRQAGGFGDPCQ